MSRMHVLCDDESLMTNDVFYEELLRDTCHPIPPTTFLDNFLAENVDASDIAFHIAYDGTPSRQKLDEDLQRNLHQHSAWAIARVTNKRYEITLRNDKMSFPTSLMQSIIQWCHLNLHHPGADRLFGTFNQKNLAQCETGRHPPL